MLHSKDNFLNLKKWLLPKIFLLGTLIGFSLCVLLGIIVSKHDKFHHFVRFFGGIQPQQQFFATNFELLNTAIHQADKNKILVLIGGSSILKGVGQNRNELWSQRLQKLLGNQFFVLNYAVDGANLSDFAGVAFRILKERYPKIIFVTTCLPTGSAPVDGQPIFSYLFWDGYYHHLFHIKQSEKKNILILRKQELKTTEGLEKHLASFLDSLFYFKPLWTWVGYHRFFTVWENLAFDHFLQAREKAQDSILDLANIRQQQQSDPIFFQQQVDFINKLIDSEVEINQPFILKSEVEKNIKNTYAQAFPLLFRQNILCVLTDENPLHLAHISKKAQLANKYLFKQIRRLLIELGYHSMIVGDHFVANDFHDARHFAKGGGDKTADAVAPQVQIISKQLNYL